MEISSSELKIKHGRNFTYKYWLKNGSKRGLFLFIFRSFHNVKTNMTTNDKRVGGVLGTRTQGGRLEGADESH